MSNTSLPQDLPSQASVISEATSPDLILHLQSRSKPNQSLQESNREYPADDRVLVSSAAIVEIIRLSLGQISPVPGVTAPVLGVYLWRGEILWVLDGIQLLGQYLANQPPHQNPNPPIPAPHLEPSASPPLISSPYHSVLVIKDRDEPIGILVSKVGDLIDRRASRASPINTENNASIESIPTLDLSEILHQFRHHHTA